MRKMMVGIAVLAMALSLAAPVAASAAPEPYCGIRWGSLMREAGPFAPGPVTNARVGQHPCFDRLVIDLKGPAPGYSVGYVPVVTQDGSGKVVPLRGGAKLLITAWAPAYDGQYRATFPANSPELANVSGFRTFRQVAGAGSFEGYTKVGLGVRARLPFRVFTLPGPGSGSRLVIDVAHRWS